MRSTPGGTLSRLMPGPTTAALTKVEFSGIMKSNLSREMFVVVAPESEFGSGARLNAECEGLTRFDLSGRIVVTEESVVLTTCWIELLALQVVLKLVVVVTGAFAADAVVGVTTNIAPATSAVPVSGPTSSLSNFAYSLPLQKLRGSGGGEIRRGPHTITAGLRLCVGFADQTSKCCRCAEHTFVTGRYVRWEETLGRHMDTEAKK